MTLIGDGSKQQSAHSPNRAFVGLIDEAAVFATNLPPAEINNMYKKGLGLTAIAPVITLQPLPKALYAGRTASFNVSVSGDTPFTYTWRSNGVPLINGGNVTGAGSNVLTVANVSSNDAQNYDVVVANLAGSTTSSVATL